MKWILLCVIAISLSGCPAGTKTPPLEAQLATACNSAASGYRLAAVNRANGRLTTTTIKTLTDLEPAVKDACDPTHPPTDVQAALTKVLDAVDSIAIANAGVK